MLPDRITAWLNSPDDYQTGLDLLRETGYTGFTLSVLERGVNAYNQTRLEGELRKWAENQNNVLPIGPPAPMVAKHSTAPLQVAVDFGIPNPTVVVYDSSTGQVIESKTTDSIDTEPVAVTDLRKREYALFNERVELKARLRVKMDEGNSDELMAERLPDALRIKAITREVDEIESQLQFHADNGYLPPVARDPAVEVDDTVALMNARSYVSRYKAKLKKKTLTLKQRQSWEVLLKQYEGEKQRLETKLNKQNDTHTTRQQTPDCPNDS